MASPAPVPPPVRNRFTVRRRASASAIVLACFLLLGWLPETAYGQSVGGRVRANSNSNVRATPAGTILYVQSTGTDGTVTNGPVNAVLNGATVTWWHVTWDSGGPGWVASSVLTVLSTVSTPGMFSISSVTPSCSGTSPRIVVSWGASSGATSYDVYRNGSLYSSGVTGTSFTNEGSNVSAGSTYTYFVRARNSAGTRDSSSMSATAPSCAVSTPGAFSISSVTPSCSGTSPRIEVSWTASFGAMSYDVYRNGSLYSSGVTGTSFTNEGSNVSAGTTYTYVVRARNGGGTRDSGSMSATALSCAASTPGSFSISSVTPSCTGTSLRIVVTWSASSGATSYDVYRNGSLYSSGVTGTSFTNEGSNVAAGTTYTYFIRARNSAGTRDSSSMSATASICSVPAPTAFSISSATPSCSGTSPRIVVSWGASSGATSYDVYRNGSLYSSGVTGTTFTNEGTNVLAGTTYTYFIRARNSAGTIDSASMSATAPSNCAGTTAGRARVVQGVTVLPGTVAPGQPMTIEFTLQEVSGAPVTLTEVAVAVLNPDGTHRFDLTPLWSNVTVSANGTWTQQRATTLVASTPAGQYRAVVRGRVAGGSWFDFETVGSGVNPRLFTVAAGTTGSVPGGFSLLGATPGCSGTSPRIQLSWSPSSNAQTYDVYRNGSLYFSNASGTTFTNEGANVVAGASYSYFIRAKNSAGTQDTASLSATAPSCATSTPPVLTVAVPNGGESWTAGGTNTVSWSVSGNAAVLNYQIVAYSIDGGQTFTNASTALTPEARSYAWSVPAGIASSQARVRVRGMDISGFIKVEDVSDANFTISTGTDTAQPFVGRVVKDLNLNGQHDAGEPFLQAPATTCGTPGEALADLLIRWTGPVSGVATVNQCNPAPHYTSGIVPVGTYAVQLTVPNGWVSTGANPRLVTVPNTVGSDPWFFITPQAGSPLITSVSPNPVVGSASVQTIDILGANFVDRPAVHMSWSTGSRTLDVTQVKFVDSSRLQVSITTQAQADQWTVRVTNPDGRSSVSYPFMVIATATPTILIDGRTSSAKPHGQPFRYSGAGFSPGATATRRVRLPNGTTTTLPPLSASLSGGVEWTFTPACTDVPGTYVITVTDEVSGLIAPAVEQTIQAGTACLADLAATSVSVMPVAANVGQSVSVTYKVTNLGSVAASGSRVTLALGTSTQLPPAGAMLGEGVVPALAPGASHEVSQTVSVPSTTAAGTYQLWLLVDPAGTVPQADRTNDSRSTPFAVQASSGACRLTCDVRAPGLGRPNTPLMFEGVVTASSCSAPAQVSWTLGDGGLRQGDIAHYSYAAAGSYQWKMTANVAAVSCTTQGTVIVATPATQGNGGVRGVVRNGSTVAVREATVKLQSANFTTRTVVTDEAGSWRFDNVIPGPVKVEVSKAGHVTTERETVITAGGIDDLGVVQLLPTQSQVRIVNVKTQYPGQVYLLPGVSAPLKYTVTVDWGGRTPRKVDFQVGGQTISAPASSSTVAQTIDVATAAAACQPVTVIATSSDGTPSAAFIAPGVVTQQISPIVRGFGLEKSDNQGRLNYRSSTSLRLGLISLPTITIPQAVPFLGGRSYDLGNLNPYVQKTVTGEGVATIATGVAPKFSFNFANALKASLDVSVQGKAQVETTSCKWNWQAGFRVFGEVDYSGPAIPIAGIGVPVDLSWGGKVSAEGDVTWNLTDPLTYAGGGIHVTGALTGTAGMGTKYILRAEGAVTGQLDLDWRPKTASDPTVDFQLKGSVRVFNFIKTIYKWQEASKVFRLYPRPADDTEVPAPTFDSSVMPTSMSRDYLASPRRLLLSDQSPRFASDTEGITVTALETAVFPFSDPHISRRDTHATLVYLRDNPVRAEGDRTETVLSRWTGQTWTPAVAMSTDGTADFWPRTQTFLDGSAMVIWEDFKTATSVGSTLTDNWHSLEISAAPYDASTGVVGAQVRLTDNAFIDRSPRVAGPSRSNVVATWLSTTAQHQMATPLAVLGNASHPTTLRVARWDGSTWSASVPAATFERPVMSYDLAYDGTSVRVVVSLDMDGDLATVTDRELFLVTGSGDAWQTPLRLTNDQVADDAPTIVQTSNEDALLWVRADDIVAAPGLAVDQRRVAAAPGYGGNVIDFQAAVAPDGRVGVFWIGSSATESDIFGVYYDPVFGVWGQTTKLSTGPGQRERNLAGVFLSAQGFQIVHNSTPASDVTFDGSSGLTDFVVLEKTLGIDVAVQAAGVTLGEEQADGSRSVVIRVENRGELAVQGVVVAVYDGDPDGDGDPIGSMTLSDPLSASATADVSLTWVASPTRQGRALYVVVDPAKLLNDRQRANNKVSTGVAQPDLMVEARSIERLSSTSMQVTARVANVGVAVSPASEIRFRSGTASGAIIQALPVTELSPGAMTDVSFTWDITSTETLPGILVAVVNEGAIFTEANTTNNSASLQLECRFEVGQTSLSVPASRREQTLRITVGQGCQWSAAADVSWLSIVSAPSSGTGDVVLRAEANPAGSARTGTLTVGGQALTVTQAANQLRASSNALNFALARNSSAIAVGTPGQALTISFDGAGVPWTLLASHPWLTVSRTSSTGAGTVDVTVSDPGEATLPAGGSISASLTVTASSLSGSTVTIPVTLRRLGATIPPAGQVDTPLAGAAGLQGAIAVTGWVVDDVGIAGVGVYRQCLTFDVAENCQDLAGARLVFVGEASVVAGARTDVEALYPTMPAANTAGWGLLVLSNMLPNIPTSNPTGGGVGTFTFYALATDREGHQVVLGRNILDHTPTTVTVANNTIAKPFGAIDTPAPGATVSGTLNNFGWALTPDAGAGTMIPLDGSTIYAFVDGVPVGRATYNLCRGTVGNPVPATSLCNDDVSGIFRPGGVFRNLDAGRGPIGLRPIDTTTLSNGLHTISWGVSDTGGRIEGIGSRYFTVLNPASDVALESAARPVGDEPRAASDAAALPVAVRTGFDLSQPFEMAEVVNGVATVTVPQLGRMELHVPGVSRVSLMANGSVRAAPVGLAVDPVTGVVTWAVGPAHFGTYRLRLEVVPPGASREAVFVTVDVVVGSHLGAR